MGNKLLTAMQEMNNIAYTENHGVTYRSTMNGLMDLFALGGAYRKRSDEDCINLFKKAFEEDETYALRCLFYCAIAEVGKAKDAFLESLQDGWLANILKQCAVI